MEIEIYWFAQRGDGGLMMAELLYYSPIQQKLMSAMSTGWVDLILDAHDNAGTTSQMSDNPINYCHFIALCNNHCSSIKMERKGSDFCDTCTTLKNTKLSNSDYVALSQISTDIEKHLSETKSETNYLKPYRVIAKKPNRVHVCTSLWTWQKNCFFLH